MLLAVLECFLKHCRLSLASGLDRLDGAVASSARILACHAIMLLCDLRVVDHRARSEILQSDLSRNGQYGAVSINEASSLRIEGSLVLAYDHPFRAALRLDRGD